MTSEDYLKRSALFLDDAVESPTQYRSPIYGRNRSSRLSNPTYPLRPSDVQDYALNSSITMSPSELKSYIDNNRKVTSEDFLQRSVQLLDEAVGSPNQYYSPLQGRHRSSYINSPTFPLRSSDVRDFALTTSITMSPSELKNFILDNTSKSRLEPSILDQHLVKNASDDLYLTFLESMQSHATAKEVFDIIAAFVQNCNNVLDVMLETHSIKDLKWLELEMTSWRLLHCLYQNRLASSDMDMEAMDVHEEADRNIAHPPSEKEIVENFYKTNSEIREYQLVVDWLEKNATDSLETIRAPKLHHYTDNTVAWENTLHQLQNGSVPYQSSRDIVTNLDPDAPLRQSKPLHDLDMEDEARLLKQVFTQIRQGRHDAAQAACQHCGQAWRAATLEGWRLYHDPNYNSKLPPTEKLQVEGNPHRDIWKLCAWHLSENVQVGKYGRAVYAALCGNLDALLPACETWDDVLWAHARVLVDQLVEREVRDNSLREYTPMPEVYWSKKLTIKETFAALDSSADPAIRQEALSQERLLQKLLILDQLPQLLNDMLDWVRKDDCTPQTRRFLAHVVLLLRMLGQKTSHDVGDEIIKTYVKVLIEQQEPRLVAYYTATLPPHDQVTLYAEFLQDIGQSKLRRVALEAAENEQLPVEAITQRVVENIRNEEIVERNLPELSADVTAEDLRKISALEWVVMYPSQRAEALWQTNALIRTFLALGKLQAARLAFNQVPIDSIEKIQSQYQVDEEMLPDLTDSLPPKVSASIQEYLSHRAYLDAQEGFADWFEHYTHARPVQPHAPGPAATFTEKVAYDHRMAAYNKELERWQASMDHQTKCVKQQLYNVLLFPQGGWLAESDHEDRLRAHQMKSLRTLCIPKIVLLLHTVLHSMELYKEAIQLADVVVDERHHIYKVYSKQQIGELLSKIRESSIASLAQKKDSWGHTVSS